MLSWRIPFQPDPCRVRPFCVRSLGSQIRSEANGCEFNGLEPACLGLVGRIEGDVVEQGGGEGEQQEGQRQHQDQADPH